MELTLQSLDGHSVAEGEPVRIRLPLPGRLCQHGAPVHLPKEPLAQEVVMANRHVVLLDLPVIALGDNGRAWGEPRVAQEMAELLLCRVPGFGRN